MIFWQANCQMLSDLNPAFLHVSMCTYVCARVCVGERRRKAVCVRKSDHLEVSDQRCEHLPRPVAVTEPCNTECEVRCALMHKYTHVHSKNKYLQSTHGQTFFDLSSHTGGMLLGRANVLLNVAQVTAAWMSSV